MERPEVGCLKYETIYEKIAKKNPDVTYHKVFPDFQNKENNSFENICNRILKACSNDNKNLVSAYWTEPDHTIHHNGIESAVVKNLLNDIDNELSKLSKKLNDTLIIISADHGAVDVDEVYLNEIKELDDCLIKPPAIESRFVTFFVKKGKKKEFKNNLKKYFKNGYLLYTKKQFLEKGFLGRGTPHENIDSYFGDYVFISTSKINIRYSLTGEKGSTHIADHGGLTKEEMTVPIIAIECNKSK